MAFNPKDLKSDEHRARHPLGRVPVLDDGDVRIYESGAIVEYVIERHKNGGLKPEVSDPLIPSIYSGSTTVKEWLCHRLIRSVV